MPLYEYRCESCGAEEEKLQAISAQGFHDCPECGAPTGMKRRLSVAAFALSGGGWYAEGYAGGKGKAVEGKPEGEAPAKTEGQSQAKPEGGKGETKAAESPAPSTPAKAGGCAGGGCGCST